MITISENLAASGIHSAPSSVNSHQYASNQWHAKLESVTSKVPYNYLSKDGIIQYKGVVFVCDEKTSSIQLGDTSDKSKTLNIPLSGGGVLKVNRDNLGELASAITMFSPEDIKRIMEAIAADQKAQSTQKEIDDMETNAADTHVQEVAENAPVLLKNEEPSFQIGGKSYTAKEWKDLLFKIDKNNKDVKEEQELRQEKMEEQRLQQAAERDNPPGIMEQIARKYQ